MTTRGEKIPDSWINCPRCGLPYSFLRCRVSRGTESWCLKCGVEEEKRLSQ